MLQDSINVAEWAAEWGVARAHLCATWRRGWRMESKFLRASQRYGGIHTLILQLSSYPDARKSYLFTTKQLNSMKLSSTIAIIGAIVLSFGTESAMGASLVDRHVKSMTNTHLFPGRDFGIIVDATEKCAAEGLDSYGRPFGFADLTNSPSTSYVKPREDRYRGMSWLGASFLRKMQEFAGVDLASPGVVDTSDDDVFYKMKTTHIVKSSPWHIDGIEGSKQQFRESWPVGFYILNDNPDAFFEFDDDELCIPIVKGNFVTFNAQKLHHTVITDGFVDLLGPFDLKGAECVIRGYIIPDDECPPTAHCINYFGQVEGVNQRRHLNEEEATEKIISGQAFYSISYDGGVTNEIHEHSLAHNITGLPRCTDNCNISVALSMSQECTKETYDDASFVPLLDYLTYTTDEEGNSSVERQNFNVDGKNPIGEQLLAFLKNVLEDPTQAQEINLSTFFHDDEGELVACSFLRPIISDEMKDLASNILDSDGSENDSAPVVAADGVSSTGSTSLLFFLAVGLSAAFVLFNA